MLVIISLALICTGCTTIQPSTSAGMEIQDVTVAPAKATEEIPDEETPEEFELRMVKAVGPAYPTTHAGTLSDPIPIGEYGAWGIYTTGWFNDERTEYAIDMKVNYSIKGDKALSLYNIYAKEQHDYETNSSRSSYHRQFEPYVPEMGNELIIINISMKVGSEDNETLWLSPSSFSLATPNGIKVSGTGNSLLNDFEYHDLIEYDVYPGSEITGNLVYEIPKDTAILLEYVDTWFMVS